jgi:D-alanyl-D-alanine carboxypeptidase/D-alanyl-D-alanine-endopeptidase (penicillin-binding protein 4)
MKTPGRTDMTRNRVAVGAFSLAAIVVVGAGTWFVVTRQTGRGITAPAAAESVHRARALATLPCAHTVAGPRDATLHADVAGWVAAHPATSVTVWRTDTACPVDLVDANGTLPLLPASNEKLLTTAAALISLGSGFRFTTRLVVATPTPLARAVRGTLAAPVTLVGSGDPVFATYPYTHKYLGANGDTIGVLASRARHPLGPTGPTLTRIVGALRVNGSIFDARTVPPAWTAADLGSIQPLSGAPTNEDFAGDSQGSVVGNPLLATAQRLRTALRNAHIATSGSVGAGPLPANPTTIAAVTSPPLSSIVRIMNVPSDDFIAEQLLKALGASVRTPGTSPAGAAVVRRNLAALLGVMRPGTRVSDGSGLSRGDRASSLSLAWLIVDAQRNSTWGSPLLASLPTGGQGTLRRRLRGVAGRVHAKTGTLNDVSSLTGTVRAANGKTYTFSILCNGLKPAQIQAAHNFQDALVSRLAHGVAG